MKYNATAGMCQPIYPLQIKPCGGGENRAPDGFSHRPLSFSLDSKMHFGENNATMKDETLLQSLEDAARRLSIKLWYEELRKGEVASHGGIFCLRGERRIIIHRGLPTAERIEVLTDILSGVDLSGIHLPPEVRERLERTAEKKALQAAEA